ncbi:MAG: hypothetical protein DDT33_01438 [Firmicutes bacterium]|nr:hypothetical protein [Bacillota bacterium]
MYVCSGVFGAEEQTIALLKIFHRYPVEKLDQHKLKEAELRLQVKSEKLWEEIDETEAQVRQVLQKGKEAKSQLEKISCANRIKTLAQKKSMKLRAVTKLKEKLQTVRILLKIKEYQADVQAAGVWEAMQKISPKQLEEMENDLIERKEKIWDRELKQALGVLPEELEDGMKLETEPDEWERRIIATWKEE